MSEVLNFHKTLTDCENEPYMTTNNIYDDHPDEFLPAFSHPLGY